MSTYQAMAQLRAEPLFLERTTSCVSEQAKIRDPTDSFVKQAILAPMGVAQELIPLMVTDTILCDAYEEGGVDAITDNMILAGVQYDWDLVAGAQP